MTLEAIKARLTLYEQLMRLDKPIGILLLLWPTLWGLWLASDGKPDALLVWIFVLGTVLMRSAGCVINDYADRNFDPHVERTRERPLAAGKIGTGEALALAGVLTLCAFLIILPLPRKVWYLSIIAVFLAASYPFTKRFFALPQAYLGVAFGFGIPMAFAANLDMVPVHAWVMVVANVFWALAYDTEYAMVDREDDMKIGIRTAAITFGRYDVAAIMGCYALALAFMAWVGLRTQLGVPYFLGLVCAAGIAGYHFSLIRGRDRALCFKAFKHNTWFGAAVFAGFAIDLSLWPMLSGMMKG